MFDLHCHSEFSIDSKETMKSSVQSAIEKNIKTICFTDHIDLFPPNTLHEYSFMKSLYFQSLHQVKYTFRSKIEVLSGAELGMYPGLSSRYDDFLSQEEFDYIILSMHSLKGKDIASDWCYNELPEIAIKHYYSEMYKCLIEYNNFDALGHIDYIDRYFQNKELIPKFNVYEKEVNKVLELLIEKDKALELNTAGTRSGLFYFHPKIEILLRYRELGGKYITLGSDAHRKDDIGAGIKDAIKLLKELGYKNTYKFIKRKRLALPLG